MGAIILTYLNSPSIYYKRLIVVDYRYDSKDAPDLSEELDYYKYHVYSLEKQCNRTFCLKCLPNLSPFNCKKFLVDYKCDFCLKTCHC